MRRSRVCNRESGFTLIEIMVAVGILAIVIGAVYGTFRAGSQSSVMVEEDADLHQTARVILGRINSEVMSLHSIAGSTASCITGESAADLGNPDGFDTLTLVTVSHRQAGTVTQRGDVCTVSYKAECTSDRKPLGLFMSEDYTLGLRTDTVSSADDIKISDLVVGMKCQYLDPSSGDWTDDWVGKTVTPTAIHIELILQAKRVGSQPISVYSTIYLPSRATGTEATSSAGSTSGSASSPGGSNAQ